MTHKMMKSAACLCCGLMSSGLFAETAPAGASTVSEEGRLPSTTVVASAEAAPTLASSAMFSNRPLIETPFSVSVYNRQMMEDQRAVTIDQVLKNDPSVSYQMPSGYYANQNFGVRGFRVDNFVGYRVDGLPVVNLTSPALDDKSQVEVLKGPAALRYGFMPPGGSINLVRKRPTQDRTTTLTTDIDTFGSFYGQVDTSDTLETDSAGEFGYRAVVAGDSFGSFYDNADGHRLFGSLLLDWKPVKTVDFWTSLSGQHRERTGYYGPLVSGTNRILHNTGVSTNTMQEWALNKQGATDAAAGLDVGDEDWKLKTSFNYQQIDRRTAVSWAQGVQDNGAFRDRGFLRDTRWDSWSNHTHVEGKFDTGSIRHEVVFGGDYRNLLESLGPRSTAPLAPGATNNNAFALISYPRPADPTGPMFNNYEYDEFGLFATDTIKFNKVFSTLLGVRYGHISAKNYNATGGVVSSYDQDGVSPTIALMVEPTDNVHTYVTYTQGMQDGGMSPATGVANPNRSLGVQWSQQLEAGVKAEFLKGRLATTLAVFQIEQDLPYRDPVTTVYDFNGIQRHRGVEVGVSGRPLKELTLGVSTMLLDAEARRTGNPAIDGNRPQYVPEYQVNFWGELEIPAVPGLAFTVNARLVDNQYLDPTELYHTDEYTVVDLGARYRFKAMNSEWTLRATLRNAFDERYFESGEYYPGDAGYLAYGAPISANFSLQVTF